MTATRDDDAAPDERYRRASDAAGEAPRAAVREAILAEARRIARERRLAGTPAANDRRFALGIAGTLAAAVLAGLVVVPLWRQPAADLEPVADQPSAPTAAGPPPLGPVATEARVMPASPAPAAAPAPALALRSAAVPPSPPGRVAITASDARSAPAPRAAPGALAMAPAADAAGPTPAASKSTASGSLAAEAGKLAEAASDGNGVHARGALDAGASLATRDAEGLTPLLEATIHGRADVVRMLLQRGADPNGASTDGRTPLAEARARHFDAIAAALEAAGAR